MHIAFISLSPFPSYSGGIENWLFNILRVYDQMNNCRVTVVAPSSQAPAFYDLSNLQNTDLIRTPPLKGYEKVYGILKNVSPSVGIVWAGLDKLWWSLATAFALKRLPADIPVVAVQAFPGIFPVILEQLMTGHKRKVVCSMRGRVGADLDELGHKTLAQLFRRIEYYALGHADVIVSNGVDTALYVRDLGKDSVVLPNGVDFHRFAFPDAATARNPVFDQLSALKDSGSKIIMTVATLRDVKGIRYLIEAASHLQSIYSERFTVVLVGKGDPSAYALFASQLGVAQRVFFAGEQRDVPAFLHLADIAVAISGGGGVSNAALEMMAARRPVIAWDNLTYSQLITHTVSGHLVEDRNASALAEGIDWLLQNPEYADHLARNAQSAAANYDWPIIAMRFKAIVAP